MKIFEIPCLTLCPNTERPVTVIQGTNRLCKLEELEKYVENILSDEMVFPKYRIELWDGRRAERMVTFIKRLL